MPLKVRELRQALTRKGFTEETKDHRFYRFFHEGKKSAIYTKISFSGTDVHDGLCSAMARQVKLTNAEFKEFVDCRITKEAYLEKLIADGHL